MIYPINIKKKIKESKHLKENSRSVDSVADWLKDSIAAMTTNQELTISRRILDSNFGFYVYWTQGFDVNDDSVIHADTDKSYGLVAALKCRNDAEWDGEYMDSPYDPKTGDLYCEDYELSPKDNTRMVAEWLLEDYNSMIELMNNNPEVVIGGLKESYDPEDCNEEDEAKFVVHFDEDGQNMDEWFETEEEARNYASKHLDCGPVLYEIDEDGVEHPIEYFELKESSSINEGLSAREILDQAKKLLEK